MLAGAVRTYLNRFAVAPARQACIVHRRRRWLAHAVGSASRRRQGGRDRRHATRNRSRSGRASGKGGRAAHRRRAGCRDVWPPSSEIRRCGWCRRSRDAHRLRSARDVEWLGARTAPHLPSRRQAGVGRGEVGVRAWEPAAGHERGRCRARALHARRMSRRWRAAWCCGGVRVRIFAECFRHAADRPRIFRPVCSAAGSQARAARHSSTFRTT